MTLPVADYHIHTRLCGHASGEPFEYVEQAIKLGLAEIGFSDHAPLVSHRDPTITMDRDQLPDYHRMIEQVRDKYKDRIKVKIGIEADFVPNYQQNTRDILSAYPYDYVIGSVHFIKKWAFDNPIQLQEWDEKDNDEVYRDYLALLRQSAQSGLFDIMGHVDLVKKFGHRPTADLLDDVKDTARVFKEAGVAIEINTSGLRKPAKEIYPSLNYLKIYAQAGVPVIFGSDSHRPKEVGSDFSQGLQHARNAGYREYVLFAGRKMTQRIKI